MFICDTLKKYYYAPGRIEKWNLLVDINDIGISDLPITIIKNLISVMSDMFPSSMH